MVDVLAQFLAPFLYMKSLVKVNLFYGFTYQLILSIAVLACDSVKPKTIVDTVR